MTSSPQTSVPSNGTGCGILFVPGYGVELRDIPADRILVLDQGLLV